MRKADWTTVCLKTALLFTAIHLVSTLSAHEFSFSSTGRVYAVNALFLGCLLLCFAFATGGRRPTPGSRLYSRTMIRLAGMFQGLVGFLWISRLIQEVAGKIELRPLRVPIKEWYADGFETSFVPYLLFCISLACFPGFWDGVIDGLGALLRGRRPSFRLPEAGKSVLPGRVGFFWALGLLIPASPDAGNGATAFVLIFLALLFAFFAVDGEPDSRIRHTASITALRLAGIVLIWNFGLQAFFLSKANFIPVLGTLWAFSLLAFPGFWNFVVIRLGMLLRRFRRIPRNPAPPSPVSVILPFRLAALMLGLVGLQALPALLMSAGAGLSWRLLLICSLVAGTAIFFSLLLSAPTEKKSLCAESISLQAIRILGIMYFFRQFGKIVEATSWLNLMLVNDREIPVGFFIGYYVFEALTVAVTVSWAVCPAFWNRLLSRSGSFIRKISIRS